MSARNPIASGVYGGVSAADRHAQRRERLMASAFDLLGTDGWGATTVRGVCARAKLTPRFFYESFADLDALVVAVFDDLVATTTTRVLQAVAAAVEEAPDDVPAHARAAIETLIDHLTEDPRRSRVLFVEALGNAALAERRSAAMRGVAEIIAAQGHMTYGPPRSAEPLVRVTATMLAGGLAELLIEWADGALDVPREELVEDCVAIFLGVGETVSGIALARDRG